MDINDLLYFLSKFEAGQMILNLGPVQLNELVRDVIGEFELLTQARGLRIVLEQNAHELPICLVDAARIGQVVRNLLSNAVKFTQDGRIIHVRVEAGTLGFVTRPRAASVARAWAWRSAARSSRPTTDASWPATMRRAERNSSLNCHRDSSRRERCRHPWQLEKLDEYGKNTGCG